MQARTFLLVAAVAATVALARPAAANGRFPLSNQLVFSPHDPGLLVARTTFGLLVSHDHGTTWHWVCETAIGLGTAQEDPCFGVTGADAIVGGLWQGLTVSPDTGCNWAFAGGPLGGERVTDLVVRPDDPHAVLALTGTWIADAGSRGAEASPTFHSQVFRSSDDATHFASLGLPIDPSVVVTTLEVAKSDPHRLYVSGVRGEGADRTAQLFVSRDDGATWTEHPVPLLAAVESAVYIGAVDPTDADVVYLRTDGKSRLLVTTDAGQSFRVATFEAADGGTVSALGGYMFGFALSPDGSMIYAGDVGDGLFVARRGDASFAHRSDVHVQCLAARDGELWACSDEATGFVVGVSADDGATFTPELQLQGIDGVLQCARGSSAAQCVPQYSALCQRLGGCAGDAGIDAGTGDAGGDAPDAGPGAHVAPRPSCGCSAVGGGGPAGLVAIAGVGLVALRRRRRM